MAAVSGACIAPGKQSLHVLAWLARVGAAPFEVVQLVLGCSRVRAHDHVRRLVASGFVRRAPMTRGDGSLIVLTPRGALMAGYPANYAPRSVAPTTWAHASACAWASAWLELRGRTWSGERELLHDDAWRYQLNYEDHRGTARGTHHPDLGVFIDPGPVAIEVELQRKSAARMRGICNMYARLTDEPDAMLAGVIYITNRKDIAATINRFAWHFGLASPQISFRTLDLVIEQTRAAAHAHAAANAVGGARLPPRPR